MLFTKENAQKVMDGIKTQTRRPGQEGDKAIRDESGNIQVVLRNGRKKWQVGHIYSVQPGQGKVGQGFILIKQIRRERVNYISGKDARAEGIVKDKNNGFWLPGGYDDDDTGPIFAFRDLWNSIYSGGMAFDTGPMVWALTFELVE